jgi:hypothetical protein
VLGTRHQLNPAGCDRSGRSICLMPLAQWALWRLRCQLAARQRTGSYLRILGSYARYATPDRTRDWAITPNIPCDPGFKPNIVMAGNDPGHYIAIFSEFGRRAISTRPSSLHTPSHPRA